MRQDFYKKLEEELGTLRQKGTYKKFNFNTGALGGKINVEGFGEVILLCSNNYIGLANNPQIVNAGRKALDTYGAGISSVRFICGTCDIHRILEEKTAQFLGMESSLSYTSCWAANTACIPALLSDGDAVVSDELNNASIIDGSRAVAKGVIRSVYKHSNMASLEEKLKETQDCGTVMVVTDGVFAMEGGRIRGNTANISGGGVYVDGITSSPGIFNMAGGTISGNYASGTGNINGGGGGYVASLGIFQMAGGTVYGNEPSLKGSLGNNIDTISPSAATGAALYNGGTAQFGKFDSDWVLMGADAIPLTGNYRDTSFTVRNGRLRRP